jgi:RNA polymerase sigma-70 factor (ECF subfamily)
MRLLQGTEPFDFAEVVERYETPLLRYVGQFLGRSDGEAEDLVQETFLRLHRQVREGGAGSVRNLSGWLFRVAHNLALDLLRGRSRELRGTVEGEAKERTTGSGEGPADELVQRAACERVMIEFGRLPEGFKQVLWLKVVEGMTLREIGEVTGLSTGNVDYRLNRALRELARRLKEARVV